VLRLNGVYYGGNIAAEIPIAGVDAADVDVHSTAVGLTAFWRPSWGTISERWGYAMSATLPFLRVHVEGDVQVPALGTTVHAEDTEYGLGDTVLFPVMLNYHANDDFNVNMRLGVYAPTGDYEEGRLANTGKNYWTLEPILGLMYLGQKNGREVSLFFGADFNTENHATEYRSGTQLHIDGTVAQHFPVGTALLGLGVTGYWYQQAANDSGSGATIVGEPWPQPRRRPGLRAETLERGPTARCQSEFAAISASTARSSSMNAPTAGDGVRSRRSSRE